MFDFLQLHPDALGLDISDLSIKIARLEKEDGTYRLESYGDFPLEKGVVEGGEVKQQEKLAQRITEVLAQVHGKKLDTKYVISALPEEQAFIQVIQMPKMNEKQLAEAVQFQAENYIPYSIDTVYLDFEVLTPKNSKLEHQDVLLVSMPREVVDIYIETLKEAGLMPLALEVESLAIARALIKQYTTTQPVLIADLGITGTSLSVFSGNSVRLTSTLKISADQFTRAVARNLQVDLKKAEELKRTYGMIGRSDAIGKEVFTSLIGPLSDLSEQIQKYMDYYESHARHQHASEGGGEITKVLLSGGGAALAGLPEFLSRELKIDVSRGNPWVNIFPNGVQEIPDISFRQSLKYTTALGLALRGAQSYGIHQQ